MKKYSYIAILLIGIVFIQSCKKGFLDRYPLDQISPETFFKNENDLKLFANRFYTVLPAQTHTSDNNSDNFVPRDRDVFLAGTYQVPNSDGNWSWSTIRELNYFLNRYQKAEASTEIKNKYVAEIKLFRAYSYWRRVVRFGDVPWLNKDLTESSPELYAPRTPRKVVMDSVLNDLNFAVANLPTAANAEQDRLNKDIANALKARICLWEGTFRKYHTIGGEIPYLQAAADASLAVINSPAGYALYSTGNINTDYYNLFIQEELRGNKENIMARRYLKDVSMHNTTRQISDQSPSFSKNFVRSFLCKDGLPTSTSPLYLNDDTPDNENTNRDPRYTQLIMSRGFVVTRNTNGTTDIMTLPRIPGATTTGYSSVKYRSPDPIQFNANQSTLDLFVFRFAETLLIYAEAKAELGEINQSIIDITINKIRARVGMANMVITSLVKDPRSDFPSLPILLDEIRRERRIELAQEGFRFDDLLRWKAGALINNPETILGMKLTPILRSQYPANQVNGIIVDGNNYIRVYTDLNSRAWKDKMYLYPLPLDELTLNPKLLPQNTGW